LSTKEDYQAYFTLYNIIDSYHHVLSGYGVKVYFTLCKLWLASRSSLNFLPEVQHITNWGQKILNDDWWRQSLYCIVVPQNQNKKFKQKLFKQKIIL